MAEVNLPGLVIQEKDTNVSSVEADIIINCLLEQHHGITLLSVKQCSFTDD